MRSVYVSLQVRYLSSTLFGLFLDMLRIIQTPAEAPVSQAFVGGPETRRPLSEPLCDGSAGLDGRPHNADRARIP